MKTINNYRGNVKKSLIELTTNGFAQTGKSGYSKGCSSKSVWTDSVLNACKELGILVDYKNTAPNGGANGETVFLSKDKRKNRLIWAKISEIKVSKENAATAEKEYKNKFISFIKENKSKFSAVKKIEGSWSEAIAKVLNENGFSSFPIGFKIIKSIIFS